MTGLTGVVVTQKAGRALVVGPLEIRGENNEPGSSLRPGDVVYILHYQGEGTGCAGFAGSCSRSGYQRPPAHFRAATKLKVIQSVSSSGPKLTGGSRSKQRTGRKAGRTNQAISLTSMRASRLCQFKRRQPTPIGVAAQAAAQRIAAV